MTFINIASHLFLVRYSFLCIGLFTYYFHIVLVHLLIAVVKNCRFEILVLREYTSIFIETALPPSLWNHFLPRRNTFRSWSMITNRALRTRQHLYCGIWAMKSVFRCSHSSSPCSLPSKIYLLVWKNSFVFPIITSSRNCVYMAIAQCHLLLKKSCVFITFSTNVWYVGCVIKRFIQLMNCANIHNYMC